MKKHVNNIEQYLNVPINDPSSIIFPNIILVVEKHFNYIGQYLNEDMPLERVDTQGHDIKEPQEVSL